jgi:intracellular proteinase inhibitor BsuPI
MHVEISVPAEVRRGDSVPIALRLVNDADTAVEVVLQGRPVAFDATVTRPDGELVWRRLAGETVTAILQLRRVPAGGSLEFRTAWDQRSAGGEPVPAGEYVVQGAIPSDPPTVLRSGPAKLKILP